MIVADDLTCFLTTGLWMAVNLNLSTENESRLGDSLQPRKRLLGLNFDVDRGLVFDSLDRH